MDIPLPRLARAVLLTLFAGVGVLFGLSLSFAPETAHASSVIQCGEPSCSVDSTVRSESSWATEQYTSSTGTVSQPGSGDQPKFLTEYVPCGSWHNSRTLQLVFSYPAVDSNAHRCWFDDRTMQESDTCPPRSDRASNGRVDYYIERVREDGSTVWLYARFRCLYPTDDYAPVERLLGSGKVYTGGQGDFLSTGTAVNSATNTTFGGVGRISDTTGYISRSVDLSNPEAYVGAWAPAFTARTLTTASGDPVYGFYRLDWRLDYRICERWAYPAWLNVLSRVDCSRSGADTSTTPYTYACNFNPPLVTGVRADALFVPSQCAPSWVCEFTGDLTVNGIREPLTVMRNGQSLDVRYPHPTASGDRLRNPGAWQYLHTPVSTATPSLTYVRSSWRWDTWETYRANGTIAFNWASDSDARPFAWTTNYRFTGEWFLPVQDAVNGGASMEWVTGSATCPQNTSSQNINVVRSVNR